MHDGRPPIKGGPQWVSPGHLPGFPESAATHLPMQHTCRGRIRKPGRSDLWSDDRWLGHALSSQPRTTTLGEYRRPALSSAYCHVAGACVAIVSVLRFVT